MSRQIFQFENISRKGRNRLVNCCDVFDATEPFGGYEMCAIGRELGERALQLYVEVKTATVAMC
jgi:acyl-CoA reductase-like NAD-dependent aldehyde dehydrogenase